MQLLVANGATSALALGIGPTDTTCSLQAGTGASFPNPSPGQYFALTFVSAASGLNREIVYVTSISGDTVTNMIRNAEGTGSFTYLAGDFAWNRFTAGAALAFAQLPAFGGTDPNGFVPGVQATAFGSASLLWALGSGELWICTTTGNAVSAVWQTVGGGGRLRVNSSPFELWVAPPPLGNDSNNGFSLSAPFATWQRAWNYLQGSVDLNTNSALVHIENGVYDETLFASGWILGQGDAGTVVFQGNINNPTDVTLNSPLGEDCVRVREGALSVQGCTVTNPTGLNPSQGGGLGSEFGSTVYFNNMIFGLCTAEHMGSSPGGSIIGGHPDPGISAVYAIADGASSHMFAAFGGLVSVANASVVLFGVPTFTDAFAVARSNGSMLAYNNVYNGTALGVRYHIAFNGTIDTQGAPSNYFPGSLPGVISTGGQIA